MSSDLPLSTTPPSTAEPAPQPPQGLHLKRPCILVSDLDQSLRLYRDVLGFRLDYVGEADADSYLYTVFQIPAEGHLTFAALSTDYEPRSLALTEVQGISLPNAPIPRRIATVIQVPHVSPLSKEIQALGLTLIRPHSFTAPPNLVFTEQGFYDFDGHLIVLYDRHTDEIDNL
ncbi:MAG: VOC family protein [Cyanobacteria bacterium P01_F01_bin.3]